MAFNARRGASSATPNSGGQFNKTHWFSVADKESETIRFLTDYEPDSKTGTGGILAVYEHQNVPTLPAPAGYKGDNWPKRMTATCRTQDAFGDQFESCYICENLAGKDGVKPKPTERYYGLVLVRRKDKDGKMRDGVRTVVTKGEDGKETEHEEKDIQVADFHPSNFWNRLAASYEVHGTLLDRDYLCKRTGQKLETVYAFAPYDPFDYSDGRRFDLREDDLMALFLPSAAENGYAGASDAYLLPIIEQRASDDYYGRFFDPELRKNLKSDDDDDSTDAVAVTADSEPPEEPLDTTNERLDSVMARLQGDDAAPTTTATSGGVYEG